jgi:hypothetical protein
MRASPDGDGTVVDTREIYSARVARPVPNCATVDKGKFCADGHARDRNNTTPKEGP